MSNELILTLFLYIIICNIIYSFFDFNYDFDNSIAFDIEQALNSKLIYNFQQKYNCDKDEEALILGKWKGLNEGCKCLGHRVTKGRCRRRNSLNSLVVYVGCEDMPAIPSKYYEKFDNKKFCVKRSTETYRYLLLNKQVINNNETCPEGYKCCGIIDTLNRKLCKKINEECPITINDVNSLKNNSENSKILSRIKISEYKPCMNPHQEDWYQVYGLEYPSKKCTEINGNKYDLKYEKLKFVTNKYDLYKDNDIIEHYPDNTYFNLQNEEIYLYGRNYIGIDIQDIKEFSYDNLIYYEKLSERHYKYIWVISISSLLCLLLCFLESNSIYLENILNNDKAKFYLFFLIILLIINIAINLILFICNLKIKTIIDLDGNDDYTIGIINSLKKEVRVNYIFNLISLIIFAITTIYMIKLYKNNML